MTAQIDNQTFEEQSLVVAFSDLTGSAVLARPSGPRRRVHPGCLL